MREVGFQRIALQIFRSTGKLSCSKMLENLRSLSTSAKQCLKAPQLGASNATKRITYNVAVTTGAMKFAGTDANVYFSITGFGGDKTSRTKLDNTFRDDFERGTTDKFKVKLEDIGIPTLVTLEVDHTGLFADWFASMVTVQKAGEKLIYEFPVYAWVENVYVACTGEACLPQDEISPVILSYRKSEVSRRRHLYKWRSREDPNTTGLPGHIAASNHSALPRNIQFTDGLYKDFEESKGIAVMHAVQDKVHALGRDSKETWQSFDEISRFLSNPKFPKIPEFQKNWLDDEEFGRQLINGCNPNVVKCCKEIPYNFPVTDKIVKDSMGPRNTLSGEMKRGKIFIADCAISKSIKKPKGCTPICMLHQTDDSELKPIAIQLQREPSAKNPIWTPGDSKHDWTLAKMYFRCEESSIQQVIDRLLYTHFALEPFAVGMLRCLSTRHPLFKLLYPHLHFVCASSTVARTSLLSSKGVFDRLLSFGPGGSVQLLRESYKSFKLFDLDVLKRLKKQGTDALANHHYRDDSIMLQKCIKAYVDSIVTLYYKTDDNVIKDRELQQFIKEVHGEGFAWEDGDGKGCPDAFSNKNELAEILTMLIFTASCQHSAVNSGQFQMYMHIPSAPFSMSKPPPSTKGLATAQTVIDSLPSKRRSAAQFDFVYALSKTYDDEVYLGNFPAKLFCDNAAQQILATFRKNLAEVSKKIKKRNAKLLVPYEYLLPEMMPAGVTV